jgi:hypothetical protein
MLKIAATLYGLPMGNGAKILRHCTGAGQKKKRENPTERPLDHHQVAVWLLGGGFAWPTHEEWWQRRKGKVVTVQTLKNFGFGFCVNQVNKFWVWIYF